ncbi:MAG: hypothetical protein K9L17_00780 [Clostridiales bacterium]|nr:hypothetical protein [Clostridiales bacterium]MCF8021227.1 hypothetical protein [Clostridiales bacterium]
MELLLVIFAPFIFSVFEKLKSQKKELEYLKNEIDYLKSEIQDLKQ